MEIDKYEYPNGMSYDDIIKSLHKRIEKLEEQILLIIDVNGL